jgi:two-component system chemotaxis sensor kinase CheA
MATSDEASFQEELRKIFVADTRQLLGEAEQYLLALEDAPENYEIIDRYFRFIHTIKGNAESIEFSSFGSFVHRFEDLISALKKVKIPLTSSYLDLFLAVNDFIKIAIGQYEANYQVIIHNPDLSVRIEQFIAAVPGSSSAPPSPPSPPPAPAGLPLTQVGEGAPPLSVAPASAVESIRVSAPKVHGSINDFGEHVLVRAALKHRLETLGNTDALLGKTLMHLEKVTNSLQSATLSLRMFPLKQIFDQMRRVVRETAKSVGKEVKLETKGEAIELDKLVLDELTAPVMHIVRNAIDHGIEASAEERLASGKEALGHISLVGEQKSGFLHLKISDDGAGINKEKLLAKAIAKGIITADHQLSEAEIFNLIFHKGLSTKEQTTEISGRGVGMDVVLDTLKKLKGSCEITSAAGRGTTMTIKVPLSLAMFEGTVFRLGSSLYIIPNADYYEIVSLDIKQLKNHQGDKAAVLVHGKMLPVVPLKDHLAVSREAPNIARFLVERPGEDRSEVLAFVVNFRHQSFAVRVDEFIAQSKVVLKHLGQEVQDTFGISGATILGDGSVVLIVDIAQILDRYYFNT